MMARHHLAFFVIALAALVAAAPLPGASPAQLTRLGIGFSNVAAGYAPLWVAQDAGFFRQYGLDADIRDTGSGAITMAAMAGGDIQVAFTGGPGTVNAILAGADVRVIGGYIDRMPFQLVVRPGIQSIQDLRGQTVAMNRFGGAGDFAMNYLLQQNGIDPRRDVSILQLGSEPDRVAALQAGAAMATVVNPPFQTVAERAGLQVIFDTATLPVAYSLIVIAAPRPLIEQ